MRANHEFVLATVQHDGRALEYAAESLMSVFEKTLRGESRARWYCLNPVCGHTPVLMNPSVFPIAIGFV